MTTPQDQTVELTSLASLAQYLEDDAPVQEEVVATEEIVAETPEEELEDSAEFNEEAEPVQESAPKKRGIIDELREERKEKREERQLRLAAEDRLKALEDANRKLLAAFNQQEAEPEEEAIDAEHINPIKEKLRQIEIKDAIRNSHDAGTEAFGADYVTARQIVVAAEIKALREELEPAGYDATPQELEQVARQRVNQRELSLLQNGKSVAEYTWKRANLIAKQLSGTKPADAKPSAPKQKIDINAINKARAEAEIAPVKRSSAQGNQAGSMKDYFSMFAAEDKAGGGLF